MNTVETVDKAAAALVRLRERRPLVCCLTNTVAANFTANALLALGARPAMVEEPSEAAELVALLGQRTSSSVDRPSGALLVNVGTLTERQANVMRAAVRAANAADVPWVLDPVAADKLAFRREFVLEILNEKPMLVRGNSAETAALSDALKGLAVLSTGPVDDVCGFKIANGVELLTRVTATGCAQGAIAAAFCAIEKDAAVAAVAASLAMSLAGEAAFACAKRPGGFQLALLDALDELTPDDFRKKARFV